MNWESIKWIVIVIACLLSISAIIINKRQQKKDGINKIEYVQKHADMFRVHNKGVSMDNREIYDLSLEDLGLEGDAQK